MDLQRINSISGLLPPAAEADALSDSLTQHVAEGEDANRGQLSVPIVFNTQHTYWKVEPAMKVVDGLSQDADTLLLENYVMLFI